MSRLKKEISGRGKAYCRPAVLRLRRLRKGSRAGSRPYEYQDRLKIGVRLLRLRQPPLQLRRQLHAFGSVEKLSRIQNTARVENFL